MKLTLTHNLPRGHSLQSKIKSVRNEENRPGFWIIKNEDEESLLDKKNEKAGGNFVDKYTVNKINIHLNQIPKLVNEGRRGDVVCLYDRKVLYRNNSLMFWDGHQVILPEHDGAVLSDYGAIPHQFLDLHRNFDYWRFLKLNDIPADLQYFFEHNGMHVVELRFKNRSVKFYGIRDNGENVALLGRSKKEFENALREKRLILPVDFPFNGDKFLNVYELLGVVADRDMHVDKIEERQEMIRVYLNGEKISKSSPIFEGMFGGETGVYFPYSYLVWDRFDTDEIPENWRETLHVNNEESSD